MSAQKTSIIGCAIKQTAGRRPLTAEFSIWTKAFVHGSISVYFDLQYRV